LVGEARQAIPNHDHALLSRAQMIGSHCIPRTHSKSADFDTAHRRCLCFFVDSLALARTIQKLEVFKTTEVCPMRIEIAGALSCGKSTLAGMLAVDGHPIVYEDLTTNPYLDLRVQDPEKYDFLCQRQFVLDKIASLDKAAAAGRPFIADFSIAAERAYVSHYVAHRPDWIGMLNDLLDGSERDLGLPDLIVHLTCAPEAQLDRIRLRGRDFEQGHDVAFISSINGRVDRQVKCAVGLGVPVVTYRTDLVEWRHIMVDLYANHLAQLGFELSGQAA
jgi:deoxyadenosine/deoxycytidine kinase